MATGSDVQSAAPTRPTIKILLKEALTRRGDLQQKETKSRGRGQGSRGAISGLIRAHAEVVDWGTGPGSRRARSWPWSVLRRGPGWADGGGGQRPVPSAGAGASREDTGRCGAEADAWRPTGGPEPVSPPERCLRPVLGPRGKALVVLGHPWALEEQGRPA
ncbi:hypothetical protein NDU88_005064 [Pleurodeles waltl]|uniref:Uncharacterized protein n=1 Tax=Pleurodeles waltl TaxID=8319 RepID=A0AAV7V4T2_PLEWA|nr:hypothetical protein NDU88_005064 [Pleurodeles waltl]